MRRLTLLFLLLATPAWGGSLADLAPRATKGDLDSSERSVLQGLLGGPQAPGALALLLADADGREDDPAHCEAAVAFAKVAPEGWAAEADLEQGKCALRSGDYATARALLEGALRSPAGFRGAEAADRATLCADLLARSLSALVADAFAARRSASEAEVAAAERAWSEAETRAQQAGRFQDVNRARRILADLHAFRLNPIAGYVLAEGDRLGFERGVGALTSLAPDEEAAAPAASAALDDLGPRGLRNAVWGDSRKRVTKLEGRGPDDIQDDKLIYEDKLAGRPVSAVYTFDRDRLTDGAYVFRSGYRSAKEARDHYRELKELMEAKYGAAEDREELRWSGDEGDSELEGLDRGKLRYELRWTFERTKMALKLRRRGGEFQLRIIYESRSEKERARERDKKRERDREKRTMEKL